LYPVMVPATGSNQIPYSDDDFTYVPSTGIVTANSITLGAATSTSASLTFGRVTRGTTIDSYISLGYFFSGTPAYISYTGSSSNLNFGTSFTNANIVFDTVYGRAMTIGGTENNVAVLSNLRVASSIAVAGTASRSAIENLAANGVGNIGSATGQFNTVFAKAAQALYADLAENYLADNHYEAGTVLIFGGQQEVTISQTNMDTRAAGVVSTDPAYLMNSGLQGDNVVVIALQGRVPTRVVGPVGKGDMLVTAPNGYAMACSAPIIGSLIGKSLENFTATPENPTAIIEVVVGKT